MIRAAHIISKTASSPGVLMCTILF
jgi:hypothetical protein